MNIHAIPRETIEADPAGYLEYRTREVIRELLDSHGNKAKRLLDRLFEDEASRIVQ